MNTNETPIVTSEMISKISGASKELNTISPVLSVVMLLMVEQYMKTQIESVQNPLDKTIDSIPADSPEMKSLIGHKEDFEKALANIRNASGLEQLPKVIMIFKAIPTILVHVWKLLTDHSGDIIKILETLDAERIEADGQNNNPG